MLLEYICR